MSDLGSGIKSHRFSVGIGFGGQGGGAWVPGTLFGSKNDDFRSPIWDRASKVISFGAVLGLGGREAAPGSLEPISGRKTMTFGLRSGIGHQKSTFFSAVLCLGGREAAPGSLERISGRKTMTFDLRSGIGDQKSLFFGAVLGLGGREAAPGLWNPFWDEKR